KPAATRQRERRAFRLRSRDRAGADTGGKLRRRCRRCRRKRICGRCRRAGRTALRRTARRNRRAFSTRAAGRSSIARTRILRTHSRNEKAAQNNNREAKPGHGLGSGLRKGFELANASHARKGETLARRRAGKGNRTLIASLEGWSFTIKLCPQKRSQCSRRDGTWQVKS